MLVWILLWLLVWHQDTCKSLCMCRSTFYINKSRQPEIRRKEPRLVASEDYDSYILYAFFFLMHFLLLWFIYHNFRNESGSERSRKQTIKTWWTPDNVKCKNFFNRRWRQALNGYWLLLLRRLDIPLCSFVESILMPYVCSNDFSTMLMLHTGKGPKMTAGQQARCI